MMVILHVIIALVSVGYATMLLVSPAKASFGAHYALISLTVASGTYLIVGSPAHMLETCTMGLLYLGFVAVATKVAYTKLAAQKAHRKLN
ncbi:MAG TPA: hypothetical protein VLF62_01495 [Candidatus Saccharimonadales bacterium]|nr:hypothetical protein [Candidatus Saccharimonadales bacterium]